jgi:hypothetical protein
MAYVTTRAAWRPAIEVDASVVVMMMVPTDADYHTGPIVVVIAVVIVLIGVAAVATPMTPIAVIVNGLHLRVIGTDTLIQRKRRCTCRADAEASSDSECRASDCSFDWHKENSQTLLRRLGQLDLLRAVPKVANL